MNKKEFEDLFLNDGTYALFFELADTVGLDTGIS